MYERTTECVICNVELTIKGRGRPSVTCSDQCRRKYRSVREARPERALTRHARTTKAARRRSGQPEVFDCRACGLPVDSSVRGPEGTLETGFAVHAAAGTDATGKYFNCQERYEADREAQRRQTARGASK